MLQSEEQAMTDHLDLVSHSLAMFASNGKTSSSTHNQAQNHGSGRGRGRGRNHSNRGRGGGRYNNLGGGLKARKCIENTRACLDPQF